MKTLITIDIKRSVFATILLALICCMGAIAEAQISTVAEKTVAGLPAPQLEFVGKEKYSSGERTGTRFKLRVVNRGSYPDSLWQPSPDLPACGKNKSAARTWIEIFSSPGSKRLAGFCALRSSEDLGQLWFPEPSGEVAPTCVYLAMTDRETRKRYNSNRVCSRSFTAGTNTSEEGRKWIDLYQYEAIPDASLPAQDVVTKQNPGKQRESKEPEAGVLDLQAEKEKNAGNPETANPQQLSAEPSEQKKLGCISVSRRWQVCGQTNFKNKFVAGVGIRFNQLDPNGRIVASQSYKDCAELAADNAIPSEIREKAAVACSQNVGAVASPGENLRDKQSAAKDRFYRTKPHVNVSENEEPLQGSENQSVTGRVTGIVADPSGSEQPGNKVGNPGKPDLIIKQFLFPPGNDKALRVNLLNQGPAVSGACRLFLTVRKINGAAAGRQTHANIPALAPGKSVWLVIDAKSILPNNVALGSTTFKLNADATGIVAESDETNNEVWHNL